MTDKDKAQAAFETLIGGGGFTSLNPDARMAFLAFARIDEEVTRSRGLVSKATTEKWEGAKRAALDAVRDARTVGVFDAGRP